MTGQGTIDVQSLSGGMAYSDDVVSLQASVTLGTTTTAQGGAQATWNSQEGLGFSTAIAIRNQPQAGGFTDADRQLLTTIGDSTVLDHVLDTLTLIGLTPGPVGGFVGAQLPNAVWGILIRLANVPENIHPQTPDDNYWVPTLATVRIFRGSDLWLRIPIHTSSKIINLANEGVDVAVTNLTATTWLLNMSLQVNFLVGVTGEVFLMKLPI